MFEGYGAEMPDVPVAVIWMFAVLQNSTGVTAVWVHVSPASLQESTVQPMPSVQVFVACVQMPVAVTHVSIVQNRLSSQFTGVPATQAPAWQVSTPLQRLPSAQSPSTVQLAIVPESEKIWSGSA